ncbi:hypothetical protein D3C71_1294400 [compost metagenome]
MQRHRFTRASFQRQRNHLLPRRRQQAGRHHDPTLRAGGQMHRQQGIFPAEHRERLIHPRHRAQEVVHVGVAGLHADNIFMARQLMQHLRRNRNPRAVRNFVDHHGQRRRIRVAQKVIAYPRLRRRRVVRRQHHQGIRAGIRELLARLQRIMKAGVQHAGNHRHAAGHGLHRQLAHPDALGAGQRAVFARAAQRHDAVDALLEQVGDQRLGRLNVDGVVGVDRRRDRGKDSAQMGCVQHVGVPKDKSNAPDSVGQAAAAQPVGQPDQRGNENEQAGGYRRNHG